jgi:hypothetical protein
MAKCRLSLRAMVMVKCKVRVKVRIIIADRIIIEPQVNTEASRVSNPIQEGEFVIIKDDPNAETWYCAEVRKILADRFEVNY